MTVLNSNGEKIFEMTGYDNVNRVFNGYSNLTAELQKQGTYLYKLQYDNNGTVKTKTGYFVVKY